MLLRTAATRAARAPASRGGPSSCLVVSAVSRALVVHSSLLLLSVERGHSLLGSSTFSACSAEPQQRRNYNGSLGEVRAEASEETDNCDGSHSHGREGSRKELPAGSRKDGQEIRNTSRQLQRALRDLGGSRDWSGALGMLENMLSSKMQVDASCFRAVLSACARSSQPQKCLALLEEMNLSGLAGDLLAQNTTISACSRKGWWREALAVLADMPTLGDARADISSVNATITACVKGQEWPRALAFLASVKAWGLQPDGFTFGALAAACEKGACWQQALELLEEATGAQIMGTSCLIVRTATISTLGRAQLWQASLQILFEDRVDREATKPDAVAWGAAVASCRRSAEWTQALALLQASKAQQVQPDLAAYTSTAAACSERQQWAVAASLLVDALGAGLSPDAGLRAAARNSSGCVWHLLSDLGWAQRPPDQQQVRPQSRKSQTTLPVSGRPPQQNKEEQQQQPQPQPQQQRQQQQRQQQPQQPQPFSSSSQPQPSREQPMLAAQGLDPVVASVVSESRLAAGSPEAVYLVCGGGKSSATAELGRSLLSLLRATGDKVLLMPQDRSFEAICRRLSEEDHRAIAMGRRPLSHLLNRQQREVEEAEPRRRDASGAKKPLLAGAVLDVGSAALPQHAAEWLSAASPEELARVFRDRGELEDDLLWERLAEAVVAERDSRWTGGQRGKLQANRDLMDVIATAVRRLADPADPTPGLAVDAIRAHLLQEKDGLGKALAAMFQRFEVGARCAVLCSRREAAAAVRHFARSNEDCNPSWVSDWPREKVAALYPLMGISIEQQEWCVREVTFTASASRSLLPASANLRSREVFVLEKQLRMTGHTMPLNLGPARPLLRRF
ncbi:unnamed protein product [Polarella glacialis]|uniref:Pentatricopeptide repeat-containing protein, chloroplastic n=1 Tax=Polarella glacialis TaxID=89957 RepID=A0A813L514_POLGL|nr:unnamed protein product [Polarella glacialis]